MVEPLIARGYDIKEVMQNLGFYRKGRHFVHPKCDHLFIEFVSYPASIGEDYRIQPDEWEVEGQVLKILSPTDCVKDRLDSFVYFKSRECLDQAILVANAQRVDFAKVKEWA